VPKPVIVIGAGRMGTALRRWLAEGQRPVRAVRGRRVDDFRTRWEAMPPALMLLAIPDDALAPMAKRLAAWGSWQGWRIVHTSGARPAAVLDPLRQAGGAVASMHPMMTFSPQSATLPDGIVFSLEGDKAAVQAAAKLVRAWRGVALRLSPAEKAAYHLAATLVGPGAVVQMAAAEAILRLAGLNPGQAKRARAGLVRLLGATAANLTAGTTVAAFTGPWARGDRGTMRLHRRWLKAGLADSRLRHLYAALELNGRAWLPGPGPPGSRI